MCIRHRIHLQFHKGLSDEKSTIYTDPLRLKQILTNLIENSLKFTEKGNVIVSYRLSEYELIFSVKDTGIGISDDKQKVIFNRFRQADDSHARKYGGTGLGLSISKKLTKLINGKMWLESTVDVGSSFFISIPFQRDQTPVDSSARIPENSDFIKTLRGKKILIVDNYALNLTLLQNMLKSTGMELSTAKDGKMAVDQCLTNHFDLILLDLQMPKLNGYETLKLIKKDRPETKIIAQTAYAANNDSKNLIKFGFDAYISKPIVKQELIEIIHQII
jgi:CheY-like chemotaxis protein